MKSWAKYRNGKKAEQERKLRAEAEQYVDQAHSAVYDTTSKPLEPGAFPTFGNIHWTVENLLKPLASFLLKDTDMTYRVRDLYAHEGFRECALNAPEAEYLALTFSEAMLGQKALYEKGISWDDHNAEEKFMEALRDAQTVTNALVATTSILNHYNEYLRNGGEPCSEIGSISEHILNQNTYVFALGAASEMEGRIAKFYIENKSLPSSREEMIGRYMEDEAARRAGNTLSRRMDRAVTPKVLEAGLYAATVLFGGQALITDDPKAAATAGFAAGFTSGAGASLTMRRYVKNASQGRGE